MIFLNPVFHDVAHKLGVAAIATINGFLLDDFYVFGRKIKAKLDVAGGFFHKTFSCESENSSYYYHNKLRSQI